MNLDDEEFLKVIDAVPLVSIDLIVRDRAGRILMGKRNNQPARGDWFVPGGRIRKGEDISSALGRISQTEVGVSINRELGRIVGVFDHYYSTNYASVEGIDTQYVVVAFECYLDIDIDDLPSDQHSEWRWVDSSESDEVHKNSAVYFKSVQTTTDSAYSVLNARRDAFNNLLWQTPVLSLVAQAFLFTIILSPNTGSVSRIIAALLALVTSLASIQLLAKHRFNEVDLAVELDSIEKANCLFRVNRHRRSQNSFINCSSYYIWLCVLSMFGVSAAITLFFPCLVAV